MGTWQIGTATQLGLLFMIIGFVCLFRPDKAADWHDNAPAVFSNKHKRVQSQNNKSRRAESDSTVETEERKLSRFSVVLIRAVGFLAFLGGAGLFIWSFL